MTQLVNEMAGRQQINRESIQVIKTTIMGAKDVRQRDPRCNRFAVIFLPTKSKKSRTLAELPSHTSCLEIELVIEVTIEESLVSSQLPIELVNQSLPN